MLVNLYLLLLSSALLGQFALGEDVTTEYIESSTVSIPISSTKTESPDDLEKDTTFFDHLRLLILVVQDFQPITSSALSSGAQLLTNAIDELLFTTDEKNEQLIEKINNLSDLVAEIDVFLSIDNFPSTAYIELFEKLVHKLDSLNATALENPSDDDLLIDDALRRYDLEITEEKFTQFYDTYLQELKSKFDVIEKELPDHDLSADESLKKWMVKTKDFINKLVSLVDFLNTLV